MKTPKTNTSDYCFFLDWPTQLARLISLYYRLADFRHLNYPFDSKEPIIITTWHSEELTLLPNCGYTKGNIMISYAKDGNILARATRHWGYSATRGSSSKGAIPALLALKKVLQGGENVIFAVDGPRGPRRVAKPGAFYLGAKTGCPVYPVGAAVSRAHVFEKSWSKSRFPLPGAKVVIYWGEPLRLTTEDLKLPPETQSRVLCESLENARLAAERELENWLGEK